MKRVLYTKGLAMMFGIGLLVGAGSIQAAAAPGDAVNVCGKLNAYQAATGGQNAVLSIVLPSGQTNFQLVGAGTVPSGLGQNASLPENLRVTGRAGDGNVLTEYTVVRVANCDSALPSTGSLPSTSTDSSLTTPALLVSGALGIGSLLAIRRRTT